MIKQLLKIILLGISFSTILSYSKEPGGSFFNSEGVKIYYTDTKGVGAPIVLLHGFSMNLDMWYEEGFVKHLAENNRVITLDLRGHGKSDKPTSPNDYGPKVGEDVVNLLNHLEISKAHMIGYSGGAFVVGRLLAINPERIFSATLASGSFPIASKEEEAFQEETAKGMESHGNKALAAMARGWRFDAITIGQIENINIPIQAVFGSEEIDDFFKIQKELLEKPASSLPILIIEGADHGSKKAAVLHPDFLIAAQNLIKSIGNQ